jgi:hypothetical protein
MLSVKSPVTLVALTWLVLSSITSTNVRASDSGFDLSKSLIPIDEIHSGGPGKDGIPSIDQPRFVTAADAKFLRDKDRVIGIHRNGISKAYPIRILNWHEVVNDKVVDEAILVTYCPLCGTGMVFSAQGSDMGLTFGVSGLLYNSDVLLYDRRTGSLWSQILSKAVTGPLRGTTLSHLPSSHTTWREWRQRYPETLVLSQQTGFKRDYRRSPYLEYSRSGQLMFPVAERNKAFRNKEMVLGIRVGDTYKAYSFKELRKHGQARFDDTFASKMLTIEWLQDDKTARALDENGEQLPAVLAYWFAWYAFHPDTLIFKAKAR